MTDIKQCFMPLGGVITSHISAITVEISRQSGKVLDYKERRNLQQMERSLFLGNLSFDHYFRQALKLVNWRKSIDVFKEEHISRLKIDELFPVLKELKNAVGVVLLSEFSSALTEDIFLRAGVNSQEIFDDIIVAPELDFGEYFDGVLSRLIYKRFLQPGLALWVDDHPFRTSAAIRRNVDGIIYVDVYRFQRELEMRLII